MLRRLRDIAIYAIAVLVGCGLALSVMFGFGALAKEVQAAPPATSDNCEKVATAGGNDIWWCVPDNSPSFYVNSVGFIQMEQP